MSINELGHFNNNDIAELVISDAEQIELNNADLQAMCYHMERHYAKLDKRTRKQTQQGKQTRHMMQQKIQ